MSNGLGLVIGKKIKTIDGIEGKIRSIYDRDGNKIVVLVDKNKYCHLCLSNRFL